MPKTSRRSDGIINMVNHTIKAFDADLESLDRYISEMGGIAEKMGDARLL